MGGYGRPVLVVVIGLLAGWLVLAITVDRVFAKRSPSIALAWNPGSADANVRVADTLLQSPDLKGVMPRVVRHADRSFGRQPLNPGAVRLLAIAAAAGGREHRAQALAHDAEAMSRRDLPTQLWLIEAAVQRNDIPTALIHYDRAMKGSVQARTLLFPILSAAASDPAIWRPLADFLARRPQWWRAFVDQMVPQSPSPDALYTIARKTGIERPGKTADPFLLQAIEKRLVDLGAYRQAADLFNRAHGRPPAAPSLLGNGKFEQPGGWDPFEWNLVEDPDLSAIRQPSDRPGGNALYVTATNGKGGDVATQLVLLPPGRYVMTAAVGGVRGDPLAFPRFTIRCARGGGELLDAPFPVSPDAGRGWRGSFVVAADCPAQRVVIRANSSLDPSDALPWVDNITIRPEGR